MKMVITEQLRDLPARISGALSEFVDGAVATLGAELKSVILYGGALR